MVRGAVVIAVLLACRSGEAPEPAPKVDPPVAPALNPPATVEGRLEAAIRSGMLREQADAVELIARVRIPKTAPLLYLALDASENVRVLAAHALVDMRLHDALPKLREVLGKSNKARDLELEVAMALYRLGDKGADVLAIVNSGTLPNHTMWRLEAALALADGGDELARAPLADIAAKTPKDADQYWRAVGGLAKLGDQAALRLLEVELGKRQLSRVLRAAKLLAHAGAKKGLDRLAAFLAEKDFETPEEAALALADEGDRRALTWVHDGLASPSAEDRLKAVSIATWFVATDYKGSIARLAASDPDERVRATAELALIAF